MILGKEYWIKEMEDMKKNPYGYHVMKNVFSYGQDIELFEYGAHLSNLCNTLRMYNLFAKEIGGKEIDFTILSKVFLAIYQSKAFTDTELEEFYTFNRELENLGKAMESFSSDLAEHTYMYSDVEMMLLGFSWEQQKELKDLNEERWGFLLEDFFSFKWDVLEGRATVKDFKEEALRLLTEALKEEKNKKNKAAA